MRAKFLSKFEYLGDQVFCYLDLDNNDIVWLKDGRQGEEIRRFPNIEYSPVRGRAIDIPPKSPLFDFLKKYSGIRKPYDHRPDYIHYCPPKD